MLKKIIKVFSIILLLGFSFFYTEKVTKILKEKDPILIKLNKLKKEKYIKVVKPIINNDEYISGINGCEIDIDKSYNKMKQVKEYKKELIVMKDVKDNEDIKNKYVVGANKLEKKVSIIFIDKSITDELINFLSNKKVKTNFFVDLDYLENNTQIIKFVSENNNIYYLGEYKDEYMLYAYNIIKLNTNNESNFCLVDKKDDDVLKLCSSYNMKTIKTNIIKDNVLENIKENLSNGTILTINSDNIDEIKVSINYILSKGYDIVTLDRLLNQSNECNNL